MSQFPDSALFKAVRNFQKAQGLKVDGVMKPEGETLTALQSKLRGANERTATQAVARALQGMGRNGDTLLAHITPNEAMILKQNGGAGTVHPVTGLLEFSDDSQKKGEYIWRTAGDGKVRSSHADRNGKTFSWDDRPEGGHPGEAPNCRCSAEAVDEKDEKCDELKVLMEEAWDRRDALHKPIQDAERDVDVSDEMLKNLETELSAVQREAQTLLIPDRVDTVIKRSNLFGWGAAALKYKQLKKREEELTGRIEIEGRTNATAKQNQVRLEHERKQHQQTAEEYSRRYKACTLENGKRQK